MDFYESYHYLRKHPMFKGCFEECLDIEVVKVCPASLCIEDRKELNTLTQVWLECGPKLKNCIAHDINLDCGADTFEEAIIELAILVKQEYGDDATKVSQKVQELYWE